MSRGRELTLADVQLAARAQKRALVPVPAADRAETLRRLRDDIQARTPRARAEEET